MTTDRPRDGAYAVPLYSQVEAARIVGTTTSSFGRWARGYDSRSQSGVAQQAALITGIRPGRGTTVSFNSLAEGFVIAAFRRVGLPMQRIRPAVEVLKRGIGLEHALISERLKTDGAEILYETEKTGSESDNLHGRLVVVRNNQAVFNEVVSEYLQSIRYESGLVESLRLPQYGSVVVTVDPHLNSGRPTITRRGVRVESVVSRLQAGEPLADVADDYSLTEADVRSLIPMAA